MARVRENRRVRQEIFLAEKSHLVVDADGAGASLHQGQNRFSMALEIYCVIEVIIFPPIFLTITYGHWD